jgi:rRNA maturation RNase YbeY
MIEFHLETSFNFINQDAIKAWLITCVLSESCSVKQVNYIFCTDGYLYDLNVKFLNHDTLTDVISFDESIGKVLQGDIFISVERVADNAKDFGVSFDDELKRVMIHGLLHFMGYKDKTETEAAIMRAKEDEKLSLFHVEH